MLAALAEAVAPADPAWAAAWRRRRRPRRAARSPATLGEELSEPRLAAELGAALPAEATLVVASSMPVRDVETFAPARDDPPRVLANRGANGIDGTLATAYGVAAGSDGPVVCLLGDVAFAYDVGSLLTARRLAVPLTIVLVDNGGGGIFDFLPIAVADRRLRAPRRHADRPGRGAGSPPPTACSTCPSATLPELRAAVDHGLTSAGTTLVVVRTRRPENVRLHRRSGRRSPTRWAEVRARPLQPLRAPARATCRNVRRRGLASRPGGHALQPRRRSRTPRGAAAAAAAAASPAAAAAGSGARARASRRATSSRSTGAAGASSRS